MDSANVLDIFTCGICLETFDESFKCPRMLSCGHSFCHSCLGRVLAQTPCCPTCKAEILFQSAESIPINYSLKSLINIRSQILMPNSSTNLEGGTSEEAYKEQKQKVSQKVKEELGQRKARTDRLNESLREIKEERKSLIEEIKRKEFELKDREKRIQELQSLKAEENKFCDKLKQLQTMVEKSGNDAEFSKNLIKLEKLLKEGKKQIPVDLTARHLPQTREALGTLCQSRSVYAVEDRYDGTSYGKVALKDGQILVACFQQEKPEDAFILALPELLSRFNNGSSELPKTVFLRATPEGGRDDSFEVIIETDGLTPRAKNFILFCSALKGPSYKGMTMTPWGYYPSSYYIHPAPSPVVKGIRDDDTETPWEEGGVCGMRERNSWFEIQLKDKDSFSLIKFGVVVAGLQGLKDLGARRCFIEECGLVI